MMDEAVANQFETIVDRLARITQVGAQVSCAQIEMMAMYTANRERELEGKAFAYDEKAFIDLIDKYALGTNAVILQTGA
jgi:hypothetical protein